MGSLNVFDGYCLFWMNFRALIRAAATREQSACQAFLQSPLMLRFKQLRRARVEIVQFATTSSSSWRFSASEEPRHDFLTN